MDPILQAALRGDLPEFTALLTERKWENHARTEPSDEPLGWKADDNKLVRLDHAVMACHIVVARIAFKSIPAMIRQRVFDFKVGLAKKVAFWLAQKLLGLILSGPRRLVDEVSAYLKADQAELEVELAIRRQSIRVMRDLRKNILFASERGGVRKTKLVLTRHPSKPQRAPNSRWRSPRSPHHSRST